LRKLKARFLLFCPEENGLFMHWTEKQAFYRKSAQKKKSPFFAFKTYFSGEKGDEIYHRNEYNREIES